MDNSTTELLSSRYTDAQNEHWLLLWTRTQLNAFLASNSSTMSQEEANMDKNENQFINRQGVVEKDLE